MSDNQAANKRIFLVLYLSIFTTMLGVGNIVPLLPLYLIFTHNTHLRECGW